MNLPIYPVKGCSITADITDEARAPVSTVMDESRKVAITRLGSRIRVGGLAEIAGVRSVAEPQASGNAEENGGRVVHRWR